MINKRINPGLPIKKRKSRTELRRIIPDPQKYPYFGIAQHQDNYPTPGMFHSVCHGAKWLGESEGEWNGQYIAYQALLQAGRMAWELDLIGDDCPIGFAAADKKLQKEFAELIVMEPFNDKCFGVLNSAIKDNEVPGPHGRSLLFEPVHFPVIEAIIFQKRIIRTVDAHTGARFQTSVPMMWSMPFIWIPAINLRRLVDHRELTCEGNCWGNGDSMLSPHPSILGLGVGSLFEL